MSVNVGDSNLLSTNSEFLQQDWEFNQSDIDGSRSNEELQSDLSKLEDEIKTLKGVLLEKERKAHEIKHRLGITPLQLMGKDVVNSFRNIKESTAVQKLTHSSAVNRIGQSYALQASKNAFSSVGYGVTSIGTGMKNSLGSLKNSRLFTSVESHIGGNVNSNIAGDATTDGVIPEEVSRSESMGNIPS